MEVFSPDWFMQNFGFCVDRRAVHKKEEPAELLPGVSLIGGGFDAQASISAEDIRKINSLVRGIRALGQTPSP